MKQFARLFVFIPLVIVAIGACSSTSAAPPINPAVTEARATEIATNALTAFNDGDYAGWTRDWSATMKNAISESDFLAFRDQVIDAKGRFVEIEGVALGSSKPGTYRYTFTVAFENASAKVAFAFVGDGTVVDGVHYE
jgi:Protein of unknown function (DUF3887)